MSVVLVTLLSTLLIQLGLFMWKLSADHKQPRIGEASALTVFVALITDWRWVSGMVANSLGWVLFVYATSLGDISLVQPLMSSGDLLLVIMAVLFLHERLGAVEWGGVLLTILGAVLLAWGVQNTVVQELAVGRLLGLLGLALAAGVTLLLWVKRSGRPEIILALVVGMCFGAGSILTKAMTAGYSGPEESVLTWRILIDPLLLSVVAANVAGLILLQAAFQRGRASVIVPVQLAMANAITVVAGILVFSENVTLLRGCGIGLILLGTAMLHTRQQKSPAA